MKAIIKENKILNLQYLCINGQTIFAYRVKGDVVTIFPHKDHFYRTKVFDIPADELTAFIEKQRERLDD